MPGKRHRHLSHVEWLLSDAPENPNPARFSSHTDPRAKFAAEISSLSIQTDDLDRLKSTSNDTFSTKFAQTCTDVAYPLESEPGILGRSAPGRIAPTDFLPPDFSLGSSAHFRTLKVVLAG
jgi:hypothetical protein